MKRLSNSVLTFDLWFITFVTVFVLGNHEVIVLCLCFCYIVNGLYMLLELVCLYIGS